ncbi:MAG: helix-turn-helix domain-containing protein [Promethearchaeota archaeon]
MLRTNTIQLIPTKQQVQLLKEILVCSNVMWNLGNYKKRQAFFQKYPILSGFIYGIIYWYLSKENIQELYDLK